MTATPHPGRMPKANLPLSEIGLPAAAALIAFAYVVLVGGTGLGELIPALQLVNGIVGGSVILAYVTGIRRADRIDAAALLALALFTAAAALSTFPRQSLDAALGALVYVAALFIARDLLARENVRGFFVYVLMALSLIVTVIIAASWVPLVLEWWALTNWTVTPALGFELSSGRWGHRHDAALLVAILYPSWWIGRPSGWRRLSAIFVGLLAFAVVLIDGSRMLWLALAIATVILVGARVLRGSDGPVRRKRLMIGVASVGLAAIVVTGTGTAVLDRLTNLASLEYRTAMWGSLTEAWLSRPVAGLGPGSFPWVLQTTGYFDTNGWAPRHPDSVLFQLLAEAGLLGLLAALALAAVLIPSLWRGGSSSGLWAVTAFAVAGIGSNPTDFAFLVVVAIAWTGYVVPRARSKLTPAARPSGTWPRFASVAAVALIGAAWVSTVAASVSYTSAISAVNVGELRVAEARLSTAISLDPGMALYWRQRGTTRLLMEATSDSVSDLQRTVMLNRSDDLAWRTLALAHSQAGSVDAAIAAADRAVATQRSDPSNLLLAAWLALGADHDSSALRILGEVVYTWPETTAAPSWGEFIDGATFTTRDVLMEATRRVDERLPAPEANEPLLATLTGREDPTSTEATGLARLRSSSYSCEPGVSPMLAAASDAQRRESVFWELMIRESSCRGESDDRAQRLYEIMTSRPIDPRKTADMVNPLHQHDYPVPFGSDRWGYRRPSIAWPDYVGELPSPGAGATRWLLDPVDAGQSVRVRDVS